MSMMLLENTHILEDIITEKASDGFLRLSGVMMESGKRNRNGRVYPRELLETAVNRFNGGETTRMGQLEHPDHLTIDLPQVSHIVESLWMENDLVMGRLKILNTPNGKIVQSLIEGGAKIGISSRGGGSTVQEGDVQKVTSFDFVALDIVGIPSCEAAMLSPIRESVEQAQESFKQSVLNEDNQKKLVDMILSNLKESIKLDDSYNHYESKYADGHRVFAADASDEESVKSLLNDKSKAGKKMNDRVLSDLDSDEMVYVASGGIPVTMKKSEFNKKYKKL